MSLPSADDATFALTHDLGAPIRHVVAFLNLLEDKDGAGMDEESRDLLEQSQRSAALAQQMLEGLNRIARVQAEPEAVAPVRVGAVVAGLRTPDGFRVVLDGDGELETNPDLLATLLGELADNAARHAGTDHMTVAVEPTASGLRLLVSDGGPGIDPERWSKLRLPFRRGGGRATTESLGLGFAVVDKIVRLHGGRVSVHARTDSRPWALELELEPLAGAA